MYNMNLNLHCWRFPVRNLSLILLSLLLKSFLFPIVCFKSSTAIHNSRSASALIPCISRKWRKYSSCSLSFSTSRKLLYTMVNRKLKQSLVKYESWAWGQTKSEAVILYGQVSHNIKSCSRSVISVNLLGDGRFSTEALKWVGWLGGADNGVLALVILPVPQQLLTDCGDHWTEGDPVQRHLLITITQIIIAVFSINTFALK